jgi:hypothetical protein
MCPVISDVRSCIVKITIALLTASCLIAIAVVYVFTIRKGRELSIEVSGLGLFEGQHFESDGKLYCYLLKKKFKDRIVDVIIYPKDNGDNYTDEDKAEILRRYDLYVEKFDTAVAASPAIIRSKCNEYGNALELTDDEIINQINVDNIKIESEGEYESYCNAGKIDENHDLVLRFNSAMQVIEVGFDG